MGRVAELADLLKVVAEDFRVHGSSLAEVGFFALAAHRAGHWLQRRRGDSAGVRLTAKLLASGASRFVGIYIAPQASVGRRVRIWHHGAMRILAKSIGDDVVLRQSTSIGPVAPADKDPEHWPVIKASVDVGSGACISGSVCVAEGAFVGANTFVDADVAPGASIVGVPGRQMPPTSARAKARGRAVALQKAAETSPAKVRGTRDQNPTELSLFDLLKEDFETHARHWSAPGFWAVAIHRLGNRRMSVRSKLVRAPLTLAYRVAFQSVRIVWGIDLPYDIKLGRRVLIGHHGSIHIGATSIGDDVIIRNTASIGLVRGGREGPKPTIGNRVEIGSGACIVGPVTIGDDCYIGPNSVVPIDLAPGSTVLGVPARRVDLQKLVQRRR